MKKRTYHFCILSILTACFVCCVLVTSCASQGYEESAKTAIEQENGKGDDTASISTDGRQSNDNNRFINITYAHEIESWKIKRNLSLPVEVEDALVSCLSETDIKISRIHVKNIICQSYFRFLMVVTLDESDVDQLLELINKSGQWNVRICHAEDKEALSVMSETFRTCRTELTEYAKELALRWFQDPIHLKSCFPAARSAFMDFESLAPLIKVEIADKEYETALIKSAYDSFGAAYLKFDSPLLLARITIKEDTSFDISTKMQSLFDDYGNGKEIFLPGYILNNGECLFIAERYALNETHLLKLLADTEPGGSSGYQRAYKSSLSKEEQDEIIEFVKYSILPRVFRLDPKTINNTMISLPEDHEIVGHQDGFDRRYFPYYSEGETAIAEVTIEGTGGIVCNRLFLHKDNAGWNLIDRAAALCITRD